MQSSSALGCLGAAPWRWEAPVLRGSSAPPPSKLALSLCHRQQQGQERDRPAQNAPASCVSMPKRLQFYATLVIQKTHFESANLLSSIALFFFFKQECGGNHHVVIFARYRTIY